MNTNILITSAGQRVVLVELFKAAAQELGLAVKVYTADMNPRLAPAGYVSDKCFQVCRCTDCQYVDELIAICHENSIGIIVPTIDTELPILSLNKDRFLEEGVQVIISNSDFIGMCRDKRKTSELLENHQIKVPKAVDKKFPVFPMFAKPYDGSLSANLHVIRCKEDLTTEILQDEKLMFMEYIDPRDFKEFTVDMYYGRDFRVKSIVPRERLKVRAGEINKGITRKNEIVSFLRKRMDYMEGVTGCICIQLFYRESDKTVYAIEINPRFGGGYPLSYHAKANFPMYILQEYVLGEEIVYSEDWLDNTLMLRYDKEVIVYAE